MFRMTIAEKIEQAELQILQQEENIKKSKEKIKELKTQIKVLKKQNEDEYKNSLLQIINANGIFTEKDRESFKNKLEELAKSYQSDNLTKQSTTTKIAETQNLATSELDELDTSFFMSDSD